ncbi:MAG: hypothetical protein V7607_2629 [Solirubrobacteraceae bacterium]
MRARSQRPAARAPGGPGASGVGLREQVVLKTSIERAYAFVADPTNDPSWWRGVKAVRPVEGMERTYDQVTTLLGMRFTARIAVVATDPPNQATLASVDSRVPFVATYLFEDLGDRGTFFTLDGNVAVVGPYRVIAPVFLPVLRRLTRRYLGKLAAILDETPVATL